MKQIKIGLIGYGTVCEGFYGHLERQKAKILKAWQVDVSVSAVLVRNPSKLPEAIQPLAVSSIEEILENPEIDIVVEAISGAEPADKYIVKALEAGKHVITANKAAIAKVWNDIQAAMLKSGATLWCEASVCGGIPIIETLKTLAVADDILEVEGILNGTTNYILTLMADEGFSYEVALLKAQQLGYAEADPAADVDGIDAANKLAILCAICFNKPINPQHIPKDSISGLKSASSDLKVIATAVKKGDEIDVKVALKSVDESHPLFSAVGVTNRLRVVTRQTGELIFTGPGAGGGPTGTALLMDLVQLIKKLY